MIEQILGIIPETWQAYFYRTGAGAEVDLLLLDDKNKSIAIEIKYSSSPKVTKGFRNAFEDLKCKRGFIIYPGEESYPIGNNVFTLPVKEIKNLIR